MSFIINVSSEGLGEERRAEQSHNLTLTLTPDSSQDDKVVIWGTGTPRRELLYVDDMAAGCMHLMELGDDQIAPELLSYPKPCFVNLGTGEDVTIRD